MKVLQQLPPNWDKIKEAFPNVDPKHAVFTYGDTLYAPGSMKIPGHLMIHEEIHASQQRYSEQGAIEWWDKFIENREFRLSQEIIAYRAQFKDFCSVVKDRNACAGFLLSIASDLSGPMYGNSISRSEAIEAIKS